MNPVVLKYLSGAVLNGLWAALVFTGKADPQPLIAAISVQLSALLGYQAVTNLQAVTPPQAPAAPQSAAPALPVSPSAHLGIQGVAQ